MEREPNKNRIDEIEKHLYEKDTQSSEDVRDTLVAEQKKVQHTWDSINGASAAVVAKKGWSFFHYLFISALIFVLGAGAFFWLSTLRGHSTLSSENIVMEITAKEFVDGGEDIDLRVAVQNGNTAALELVDMVIEYPLSADSNAEIDRIRRPIGTIGSGNNTNQTFDVQLFGAEGEERRIEATLEYRISGSSAIFTKTADVIVGIRSAPLLIVVDAPERMVSGQSIPLSVTLTSNAKDLLPRVVFTVDYPVGFNYSGASPEPTLGSSTWEVGNLEPGQQKTFFITGDLNGPLNSGHTFRFRSGEEGVQDVSDLETLYASYAHVVELEDTFLAVDVELDNERSSTVAYRPNDEVRGEIALTNTQDQPLTDVRVRAQWVGSLLDTETIRVTKGRYDSAEQAMLWSQDQFRNLERIEVGEEEVVSFSFDIKTPADNAVNPDMNLFVDIRATGIDGSVYEANTVATRTIALNSHVVLDQETLHASGPLPTSGPMPPEVGQTTVYTLHWDIHNSSNALSNATVTARLPDHVGWVGQVSPQSERMTYNTETRELIWDMGGVVAGAGFGAPAREVWFQVSVTPSSTDEGKPLDLTRGVVFQATDTFTNEPLTVNRAKHTTRLRGDTVENDGRVQ